MTNLDTSAQASSIGDLQILGAAYGLADVTKRVIDRVNRNTVPQSLPDTAASNSIFPDGWPGEDKSLTVFYRYGPDGRIGIVTATEYGKPLTIKGPPTDGSFEPKPTPTEGIPPLSVLGATYGPADVTGTVKKHVDVLTQSLDFKVNNATFGNPWNRRKAFVALLQYDGQVPFMQIAQENDQFVCKYSPPVKILGASWGVTDVSNIVVEKAARGRVVIDANTKVLGDGWVGVDKTLVVIYQYLDQVPQIAIAKEYHKLTIEYNSSVPQYRAPVNPRELNVLRAAYGPADVTAKVRSLVKNQALKKFTPNNATFGDTWRGTDKSFSMTYTWGPSLPISLVVREDTEIDITEPPHRWTPSYMGLVNAFGDGDTLRLQSHDGKFWRIAPNGQIVADTDALSGGAVFAVRIVTDDPLLLMLGTEHGTFVGVGADGTLYAGGSEAEGMKIAPALTRDGSIVLGHAQSEGLPFMALDGNNHIVAGGSSAYAPAASFSMYLATTDEGRRNHLAALGIEEGVESDNYDVLLAELAFDLTVGLFLALFLGPFVGKGIKKVQVLQLVKRNPKTWEAFKMLINAIASDPSKEFAGALIPFLTALWEENVLWAIMKLALKTGGYWLLGKAFVKVLELTLLPEVAVAEILVGLGFWMRSIIEDVINIVNSKEWQQVKLAGTDAVEALPA